MEIFRDACLCGGVFYPCMLTKFQSIRYISERLLLALLYWLLLARDSRGRCQLSSTPPRDPVALKTQRFSPCCRYSPLLARDSRGEPCSDGAGSSRSWRPCCSPRIGRCRCPCVVARAVPWGKTQCCGSGSRRIHMFLGLPDPDLLRSQILISSSKNRKKNHYSYYSYYRILRFLYDFLSLM